MKVLALGCCSRARGIKDYDTRLAIVVFVQKNRDVVEINRCSGDMTNRDAKRVSVPFTRSHVHPRSRPLRAVMDTQQAETPLSFRALEMTPIHPYNISLERRPGQGKLYFHGRRCSYGLRFEWQSLEHQQKEILLPSWDGTP